MQGKKREEARTNEGAREGKHDKSRPVSFAAEVTGESERGCKGKEVIAIGLSPFVRKHV